LLAEPARKIIRIEESTRLGSIADPTAFHQFFFAKIQADRIPVALQSESLVALEKAVEVVRIAPGFPTQFGNSHIEKSGVSGERLHFLNHTWNRRGIAWKESQRAEGSVEDGQRGGCSQKTGLDRRGVWKPTQSREFVPDFGRLGAAQHRDLWDFEMGHPQADHKANRPSCRMFSKGVTAAGRNPDKHAGFHCMNFPVQHQLPPFGQVAKNLPKGVPVRLDGIDFQKVLMYPEVQHRKSGQANIDLLKEK
jgi:hypothetical protein